MNTVYIYTLSDPVTGQIRYVGKTTRLKARLAQHLRETGVNKRKAEWLLSLAAQKQAPVMDVIEEACVLGWKESEKFWITYLRFIGCDLLNLHEGGSSLAPSARRSAEAVARSASKNRGKKRSPEFKARMSAALRGIKRSQDGREAIRVAAKKRGISPAATQAARLSRLGVPFSAEHRKNISIAATGRIFSKECREKMSTSARARRASARCTDGRFTTPNVV